MTEPERTYPREALFVGGPADGEVWTVRFEADYWSPVQAAGVFYHRIEATPDGRDVYVPSTSTHHRVRKVIAPSWAPATEEDVEKIVRQVVSQLVDTGADPRTIAVSRGAVDPVGVYTIEADGYEP